MNPETKIRISGFISFIIKINIYIEDGNTVLKNINLSVNSGDFLTIIGPSGAGKSTLLKIIASLLTPTSGSIEYEGKDISQYSPLEYRRQVSYCFQQPSLYLVEKSNELP